MSSKWWLVAAASGVLALERRRLRRRRRRQRRQRRWRRGPLRHDQHRRLEHGLPVHPARSPSSSTRRTPTSSINVGQSGTGGGFEKFCAGETDISDASRPIEEEEIALCEKDGIAYEELQVATDGIAVVTNPAHEVSCLSTEQLKQLWNKGSTVANLSELGNDADSGEALPDAELSLSGPGTDSGTFDFFTETINGEEGVSREDYQPSEDDNVIVQTVSGDEGGLGYFGFSYYEQNADALNLVSVDAGEGCVAPSIETIQDESYVLSRPLFMYPSDTRPRSPRSSRSCSTSRTTTSRSRPTR